MHTNLKASESTIRDVDYAQEFVILNKMMLLTNAGMFAISQANIVQDNLLKLLFK